MRFIRNLVFACGLLVSFDALAGVSKLDKLATEVGCGVYAPDAWPRGESIGFSAVLEPVNLRFLGRVEQVTGLTTPVLESDGRVRDRIDAGALFVDAGESRSDRERAHAHRIWKWLNRHVGAHETFGWGWLWKVPSSLDSDIKTVHMVTFPDGVAVILECE